MKRVTCGACPPEPWRRRLRACGVRRACRGRVAGLRANAGYLTLLVLIALSAAPLARTEALPELRATDISGATWTTEQLRGRVTVIDFWATWCAPCLAEMPRLKRIRDSYSRSELEILGVALEPGARRTLMSWLNRNRVDWPQIQERGYDSPLATAFGVRELPTTIVVNADGRITAIGLHGEALEQHVAGLVVQARQRASALGVAK
jgi:thiol-disulfide isomerase/thioredoxin